MDIFSIEEAYIDTSFKELNDEKNELQEISILQVYEEE